jgi:MoaA/NifB/PqqE/SkfB family radical SAM enzyme
MDDLKRFRVPVLILSGGEPLLRPDIFDIARHAKSMGFYVGLSSNGTLIDAANIERIADMRLRLRRRFARRHRRNARPVPADAGRLRRFAAGIRLCRDLGLKIGVRFTMTQDNAHDLPRLLELVEDEGIDRFYFSHLNYAGRGNKNRQDDAQHRLTRWAMDLLFDTCWDYQQRGLNKEFTSGNNDADGVYFLHWVQKNFPDRRTTSAPGWSSGAAIHRGSTWPTSTISATSIPTPCGGTTASATFASARFRTSGGTSPIRCWPA